MTSIYIASAYKSINDLTKLGAGLVVSGTPEINRSFMYCLPNPTEYSAEIITLFVVLRAIKHDESVQIYIGSKHILRSMTMTEKEYMQGGPLVNIFGRTIEDYMLIKQCDRIITHKKRAGHYIQLNSIGMGMSSDMEKALTLAGRFKSTLDRNVSEFVYKVNVTTTLHKDYEIAAISESLAEEFAGRARILFNSIIDAHLTSDINNISMIDSNITDIQSIDMFSPEQIATNAAYLDSQSLTPVQDSRNRNIFVYCSSHNGLAWIKYPRKHRLSHIHVSLRSSEYTFVNTKCNKCRYDDNYTYEKTRIVNTRSPISDEDLPISSVARCMAKLSNAHPDMLRSVIHPIDISLETILKYSDVSCKVYSIDIPEERIKNAHEIGFI
jgi:hypothetical protein